MVIGTELQNKATDLSGILEVPAKLRRSKKKLQNSEIKVKVLQVRVPLATPLPCLHSARPGPLWYPRANPGQDQQRQNSNSTVMIAKEFFSQVR